MASKRMEIADAIRREIEEGKYEPGEQLPGVGDINYRFGVSTATSVAAMGILGEQGVTRNVHGVGYFVAEQTETVDQVAALEQFAVALKDAERAVNRANALLDTLRSKGYPMPPEER